MESLKIQDFARWAIAPALYDFLHWVHSKSVEGGATRVLFVSREGDMLSSIWKALNFDIPGQYLPVSRAFLYRASLAIGPLDTGVFDRRFHGTNAGFLSGRLAMKLNPDDLDSESKRFLLKRYSEEKSPVAITKYLSNYAASEGDNLTQTLNTFIEYLDLNHEDDKGCWAIVDVGYTGTIQDLLQKCVKRDLTGYYIMTTPGVKYKLPNKRRKKGWLVDNSQWNKSTELLNSIHLERLLQSNTGRLVNYSVHNGKPQPIFEDSEPLDPVISEFQKYVLTEIIALQAALAGLPLPNNYGNEALGRTLRNPKLIPCELIRDFKHVHADEFSRSS